ncbi:hypothetical protein KFK09_026585 [Dendrobium nobile]|uniref:Uncharacterized protein n=1 Tax=Dendrobium nobile TaxID=94219 RepID=A0A8T3A8I6_DENNO|nr:hypothetical protein KFK09_026585 [Dendrobium nobile]
MELFPTIISNARTIEVLVPGMDGNNHIKELSASMDWILRLSGYVDAKRFKIIPNLCHLIVWVEHMKIEAKNPIHQLDHDLVDSGIAFRGDLEEETWLYGDRHLGMWTTALGSQLRQW